MNGCMRHHEYDLRMAKQPSRTIYSYPYCMSYEYALWQTANRHYQTHWIGNWTPIRMPCFPFGLIAQLHFFLLHFILILVVFDSACETQVLSITQPHMMCCWSQSETFPQLSKECRKLIKYNEVDERMEDRKKVDPVSNVAHSNSKRRQNKNDRGLERKRDVSGLKDVLWGPAVFKLLSQNENTIDRSYVFIFLFFSASLTSYWYRTWNHFHLSLLLS